jgi:hypothetical protein
MIIIKNYNLFIYFLIYSTFETINKDCKLNSVTHYLKVIAQKVILIGNQL